jgi:trehalose 6-phosphate synthase/phosphatase
MDSSIVDHYVQSHNRLFLLDYDGTLVGYKLKPELATPTKKLLSVLRRLGADRRNQVVIVSGRDRHFLDEQFDGLPLGFAAEHGYFIKDQGGRWRPTVVQKANWKPRVLEHMEAAAARVSGVSIEEKSSSLVWHYDGTAAGAAAVASKLRLKLLPHLEELGLVAEKGRKILEVRVEGVHKGQVVSHWLRQARWDFVLAAGDDTTDEDLFAALPSSGISIKVGAGTSCAQSRMKNPAAIIRLLENLANSPQLSRRA